MSDYCRALARWTTCICLLVVWAGLSGPPAGSGASDSALAAFRVHSTPAALGPAGTHNIYLPLVSTGDGQTFAGITFSMNKPPRIEICNYSAAALFGATGVETSRLDTAQSCGTEVIVALYTSTSEILNDNGVGIDLDKFETIVQGFVGVMDPYVGNGTIVVHHVVDEPHDCIDWGGLCPTAAEVEQAGRISKQYWPTLRTMITTRASYEVGHPWQDIDIINFQYAYAKGPLDTFIEESVAIKDDGYVGEITWSMQALAGGCDDFLECPMSEDQVMEVGTAMCDTGKGLYLSFMVYSVPLLDPAMEATIQELTEYCGS